MIYRTKRFSKGKETAKQKQDRRTRTANIISGGTLLGGTLGTINDIRKSNKILDKARKIVSKNHDENMRILDLKIKTNMARLKGARPRNQKEADMLKYYLDKANHYLDVNDRGRERVLKIANKMNRKNELMGLKGAVIGAAVTAPIAYAANKAMKKANSQEKK